MKILIGTPEQLEAFMQELVDLAKFIFPQIGRTVIGEFLLNRNQGEDTNTATSLKWDNIKYDEAQDVHYISNIMYVAGYDQEYLDIIQAKLDVSGLIADDNFVPTQPEELI